VRLNLSGNFVKSKQKHRVAAIEALINLAEKKSHGLQTLIIRGTSKSQLKTDLGPFLLALMGDKVALTKLDITGQGAGEMGAMALGKILQTNTRLLNLAWDDNHTTVEGFAHFVTGLERNRTIQRLSLPVCDIALVMKEDPNGHQRISEFVSTMQKKPLANQRAAILKKTAPVAFLTPSSVKRMISGEFLLPLIVHGGTPPPSPPITSKDQGGSPKPLSRETSGTLSRSWSNTNPSRAALSLFPELKTFLKLDSE